MLSSTSLKKLRNTVDEQEKRTRPGFGSKLRRIQRQSVADNVTLVAVLPPIPSEGVSKTVRWGTEDDITGGTGDGQLWVSWPDAERWYPASGMYTTKSGLVVEE